MESGSSETIHFDMKKVISFFSQKKVQWAIAGILLIIILFWSSSVRMSNLSLLQDQTTGEYIPLALDPFYFLRAAQTIEANDGTLPAIDPLRKPLEFSFTPEILPDAVVLLHKIGNVFGDYSLQYIDVISPVIFYILGLIVFFILTYLLTRSKIAAIASSLFLAFIPSYLYRSMAGFADHESIGMFAFFLTLLPLLFLFNHFERNKTASKKDWMKPLGIAGVLGVLSTVTLISWGGITQFLFMIVPLSFFLFWITRESTFSHKQKQWFLGSYFVWALVSILIGALTRYGISGVLRWFTKGIDGTLFLFVGGFLVIDWFLEKRNLHNPPLKKYRLLVSVGATIVLGFILLFVSGTNPFDVVGDMVSRLLHPFGTERVSLTVAENKQPFLEDWTAQIGPRFFWVFLAGSLFLGFTIAKSVKEKKDRWKFVGAWILLIGGITLSRISSTSLLNGTNFLSKLLYLGGVLLFALYALYLHLNKKLNPIEGRLLIFAAILIPMLIGTRGAVRLFFVITPVTCLMAGYALSYMINAFRRSKGELARFMSGLLALGIVILLIFSLVFFVKTSTVQATYTGPSANQQWQQAMQWVRENTSSDATFLHWWDYGYWVQYLGERSTLSDGGRFQGAFRDHLIGRYFLTNSNPASALSFMKSNNATHLLIDQTDIGKYSAFSSIGSDASGKDRYSWIPALVSDPSQTQETKTSVTRVYQGGYTLDSDVLYTDGEGNQIFLPQGRAAIIGVILQVVQDDQGGQSLAQPTAVFAYNNQQYRIPVRSVYFGGNLLTFSGGLDVTLRIIPSLVQGAAGGGSIDEFGALLYLSKKTKNSLFSQLYLMNDPENNYQTLTLAHSEPDSFIASLESQGAIIGEFLYYQGTRGPLKIWEVQYPDNILTHEEFTRFSGEYAEFDNLTFQR